MPRTERLNRARIGVFGGTFDPIHVGHLALVRWARDSLHLDRVLLVPTGRSWQKQHAASTAAQRLDMVRLAVANDPSLSVDDREVCRDGPSYTVDTLTQLRAELGPQPAIVLLLGSDQLHNLASWHRHQDLLGLAHIGVTQRERVELRNFPPAVEDLLLRHGADALPDAPAGKIVFFRMPPVPVSGTALRARLAAGERPAELVPAPVLDYIDQQHLYRHKETPD